MCEEMCEDDATPTRGHQGPGSSCHPAFCSCISMSRSKGSDKKQRQVGSLALRTSKLLDHLAMLKRRSLFFLSICCFPAVGGTCTIYSVGFMSAQLGKDVSPPSYLTPISCCASLVSNPSRILSRSAKVSLLSGVATACLAEWPALCLAAPNRRPQNIVFQDIVADMPAKMLLFIFRYLSIARKHPQEPG
jgi:hypothetical protein